MAELTILQGPPGTGKTYHAARRAALVIDPELAGSPDDQVLAAHNAYVAAGRIIWVTFHPSYAYEDFVEGFRPTLTPSGQVTFAVQPGPFRIACEATRSAAGAPTRLPRVGDQLGGRYSVIAVDGGGVVLESEPVRADAIVGTNREYVDFWTVRLLRACGLYASDLSPSGQMMDVKAQLARLTRLPATVWNSTGPRRALFEWMYPDRLRRPDGEPLPDAPPAQQVDPAHVRPAVLVIDEMNRADLSRVFGELMTLLELDKREGAPEEKRVRLPYSGETFSVPSSLSIVGTMNTADRSLAVLDVALRRRFQFIDVEPNSSLCPVAYGDIDIRACLDRWNHRLTALLSRDNRLGHSDFMLQRLDGIRVERGWLNDADGQARAVARTVRENLVPLLLEYFHDDWRAAHIVLGNGPMLEPVSFDDVQELAGDELDLSQSSGFRVAPWSNPDAGDWDARRLIEAVAT